MFVRTRLWRRWKSVFQFPDGDSRTLGLPVACSCRHRWMPMSSRVSGSDVPCTAPYPVDISTGVWKRVDDSSDDGKSSLVGLPARHVERSASLVARAVAKEPVGWALHFSP